MWRSQIFWRLFGAYSVLLAVSLGLLGWILLRRIENHLLKEIQQNLEMKTLLVGEIATRLTSTPHDKGPRGNGSERDTHLQEQMTRLARDTNARITLLDSKGKVLADSAEKPELMENHLNRVEIQQAETSIIGVATRFSDTVHQSMMYVARRIASNSSGQGGIRYVRLAMPLDAVAQEIAWLRRVVWTGTGITLLLALGLSLLIARRLIAPLVELAGAAQSIAWGDYGKKVEISSSDEVGALARSFNEMSQACANHISLMDQDRQQLRAIFRSMVEGVLVLDADRNIQFLNEAGSQLLGVSLEFAQGRKIWQLFRHRQLGDAVEKILVGQEPYRCELDWIAAPLLTSTPRTRGEGSDRKVLAVHGARLPGEPLRGAVLVFHDITHLRKLERVRQDFVANVSHELKTPLAAIQATVETLLNGAMQDPGHNLRFLERIRENSERLYRLVLDLLSLGRVESGQETFALQPIPLRSAVEACISRQGDRAQAKELQLIMEAGGNQEEVLALADEEPLAEILDNLVDNALKYTPAGGKITLRWFAEGEEAIMQVEDTGLGIPGKDLPRIFERFYRVDKARSRELGGTGLGLSIVKHLVQALGGSITAASQVGQGSIFTVRFPRVYHGAKYDAEGVSSEK